MTPPDFLDHFSNSLIFLVHHVCLSIGISDINWYLLNDISLSLTARMFESVTKVQHPYKFFTVTWSTKPRHKRLRHRMCCRYSVLCGRGDRQNGASQYLVTNWKPIGRYLDTKISGGMKMSKIVITFSLYYIFFSNMLRNILRNRLSFSPSLSLISISIWRREIVMFLWDLETNFSKYKTESENDVKQCN